MSIISKNIIKKLPGFRSNKLWKKIIAVTAYSFFGLVVLALLFPTAPSLEVFDLAPTNKSNLAISGKTKPNTEILLYKGEEELQQAFSDSNGDFIFALNNLSDGHYNYTVKVCEEKRGDDKCTTENVLVSVDQTPPITPTLVVSDQLPDYSEEEFVISGVAEPGTTISFKILENETFKQVIVGEDGKYEISSKLTIGGNTIQVSSLDTVGNESDVVVEKFQFNPKKYKARVASVIDGDTIKLESGETVRYIGIDTPETVHPTQPVGCYGVEASSKNKELVLGKEVILEKDVSETDRYGRLLRYVWVDGTLVNEYLVREGYAQASSYPPDVKYQARFTEAQRLARNEKKGLWGDVCNVQTKEQTNMQKETTSPTSGSTSQGSTSSNTSTPAPTNVPSSGDYACNCSKTCTEISSCAEAQYLLNVCGCTARDRDKDGIACDGAPLNCQ